MNDKIIETLLIANDLPINMNQLVQLVDAAIPLGVLRDSVSLEIVQDRYGDLCIHAFRLRDRNAAEIEEAEARAQYEKLKLRFEGQ